jgi:hypothetical protein
MGDFQMDIYQSRGRDRMVLGFTTTCATSATKDVSLNPVRGEVYSMQHYVINFVTGVNHSLTLLH